MTTIKVADYYTRCGVRAKGKEFLSKIKASIPEEEKEIQFDFVEVTFVSASFLEESIFKLLDDYQVSVYERASDIHTKAKRIISWNKLHVTIKHEGESLRFLSF